jgi:hypothetical protein
VQFVAVSAGLVGGVSRLISICAVVMSIEGMRRAGAEKCSLATRDRIALG